MSQKYPALRLYLLDATLLLTIGSFLLRIELLCLQLLWEKLHSQPELFLLTSGACHRCILNYYPIYSKTVGQF